MSLTRDADDRGTPASPANDDEAEDYYSEVERHFVALRGSPLFVSPREWQLIHRWHQAQIPLRVVKRGLDQAFEKSKPNRPVRRLSYCRQTVEAHYRRFREAVAGSRQEGTEGAAEPTDVQAHLGRLQAELVRAREKVDASRAPLGAAIDRAARSLAALASEPTYPTSRLDELEQELDRLEGALMEAAESVLRPSDRQRLLDEAERSLRDYRGRMPSDVLQSALRAAYLKRVRALFELPALSLFYI